MTESHQAIDWTTVHDRLRASESALRRALEPDPDARRAALARVAAGLAARIESAEAGTPGDNVTLLVFRLGEDRFAVELKHVREVGPLERWTSVPGGAAHLLGVMLHRGEARSVIDLAALLGRKKPEAEAGAERYVVHLAATTGEARLCVDGVEEMLAASAADLLKPTGEQGREGRYVAAFHRAGIVVLHSDALCAARRAPETERPSTREA